MHTIMRRFALLFAVAVAAQAQSLVEEDRAAALRQEFERPSGSAQLRCEVSPVKPALHFDFRFQTGYRLTFPLSQFAGGGRISIHVRVTPEDHRPVYLTTEKAVPDVPDIKADGVEDGLFAVGEGLYTVDLLMLDDARRVCRSSWRIQARGAGAETSLVPAIPPFTVTESDAPESPVKAPADIAKLTILLHAAPLNPGRAKLQDDDVAMLTDSLGSLLRQWRARRVRLIAFNLAQASILLQKEGFQRSEMDELTRKLQSLELGAIDYRTLSAAAQPIDLLSGLLKKELGDPQPADAIVILGPQMISLGNNLPPTEKRSKPAPIFYLQYLRGPLRIRPAAPMPASAARGQVPAATADPLIEALAVTPADAGQKLVARFKGETISIRTPHDLAEAIRRVDPRIARTPPPLATEPETATITPPVVPAPPKPAEPELPAAGAPDPVDVLARLRDRVLEHGHAIPDHMCVETVERSRFDHAGEPGKSCDAVVAARRQAGASARLRLTTTDRLRLDVALATEREVYSWAGANQFDNRDIDEIVPQGAMGTGPFAAFLLSVFTGRPPRFVFEGETTFDDRAVYEYSFDVPLAESHFRFKAHKAWIITPYSGKLFVDTQTSDLLRLTVRSDELPPETDTCELDTTLDYSKVQLSSGLFFLPASATQQFVGRDGAVAENAYTFSACRDFQAESRVSFEAPAGDRSRSGESDPRPVAAPWTPGLPAVIEVLDSVDSAIAAAGDAIHGRFVQPVRDRQGGIVVPAGTRVNGRLMRVEVRHPSPQVTIALRWETMEWKGQTLPIALDPDHKAKSGSNIQLGGLASLANLKRRPVEFELPLPGEERFGIYRFTGQHALVESGLRTEWLTAQR